MIGRIEDLILRMVPSWLVTLALRVGLGLPFIKSGLTKWDGFGKLSESAVVLFQEEFKINFLGTQYGFPEPEKMALASAIAEIALPIMLFLGFGTRIAALGLLLMTIIIQLVKPDAWATYHLPWAAMALALLILGSGKLSLDWWLRRSL